MVEIECLACDKTLKLPQFIDTANYDGQLVCSECKALLHVKLVKGKIRKYKIVEGRMLVASPEQLSLAMELLLEEKAKVLEEPDGA